MSEEIDWTFKSWIENFKDVDLPIGDLAKDILADDDFPEDDTFYDILEYIARKSHYDHVIIDTFRTAWNFYVATT